MPDFDYNGLKKVIDATEIADQITVNYQNIGFKLFMHKHTSADEPHEQFFWTAVRSSDPAHILDHQYDIYLASNVVSGELLQPILFQQVAHAYLCHPTHMEAASSAAVLGDVSKLHKPEANEHALKYAKEILNERLLAEYVGLV